MTHSVTTLALGPFVIDGIDRRDDCDSASRIDRSVFGDDRRIYRHLFLSRVAELETPGIILSALAVGLGTWRAWTKRPRTAHAQTRKVVNLHTGEYLSDSGHWRRAS
jgi:hypothetical protein